PNNQFTDDASVFEHAGHSVHLIEGSYQNIKITNSEDLIYAQALLSK
ncbi:MAG: 2-C-methyl-D-erythritol 4-phosphate cytidylyltransferase, partial [Bacteroidetes bacterium]|nr:2-C-methyl-D-erythritol 4-phosphate cytidylyltransferase [Bacteroidota bacterium]